LFREGARRIPLGRRSARDAPVAASLREEGEDADARDPRRARLPRTRDAGPAVLQFAESERRPGASCLLSRREPLDPEAAELAALVSRSLRLACTVRAAGPPQGANSEETCETLNRHPRA